LSQLSEESKFNVDVVRFFGKNINIFSELKLFKEQTKTTTIFPFKAAYNFRNCSKKENHPNG